MLQAYADAAEAFTSTVSERESLPLDWWMSRVSDHPDSDELVFGAFEGARLVGVAGIRFGSREQTKHRATLFGLYVLPGFRGQTVARSLVEAVLSHARSTPGTQVVQLSVTEENTSAISLYEACGFVAYGTEPLAVRYGEKYVSKVHMSHALRKESVEGEVLRTPRLVLREFDHNDFEAVHAYATDLEVVRYMEWGPNTAAETRNFLTRAQSQASARPRTIYEFAVAEVATDGLVGGIGLHLNGPQAMLGYCLSRSAWGRGFATEAASLLVAFGFDSLDIHRVWARCDSENAASLRVLEKLRMRREGLLEHDCQIRGEWRDTALFAILESEWRVPSRIQP